MIHVVLYIYHVIVFCQFTSLAIHQCFALSLVAVNMPVSHTTPAIDSRFPLKTYFTDEDLEQIYLFVNFLLVACSRLSWQTILAFLISSQSWDLLLF